ncbi:UPF0187-domain-containing protein [Ceratobasidium sp. AG-I]|nr:UPF0187-domain-containing protein [Ceratobasidium sp. AG-I]
MLDSNVSCPQLAHPDRFFSALFNAISATTLLNCWKLILVSTGWAACICLIIDKVHDLSIQPTLLTALGTMLGFVISYRTTSAFERYNEGRRLWSCVIHGSRTFARTIWFHVPDTPITVKTGEIVEEQTRNITEKRTAINLVEAFSVAVKHYLRGEEGIYYEDLYHLVKFLPRYSREAKTLPMAAKMCTSRETTEVAGISSTTDTPSRGLWGGLESAHFAPSNHNEPASFQLPPFTDEVSSGPASPILRRGSTAHRSETQYRRATGPHGEAELAPSSNPPKRSAFNAWPLSMLFTMFNKKGKNVDGKIATRERAKPTVVSQNIPLQITLYMSSYISALQQRKVLDVPTTETLLLSLNQLVDSLSGFEQILTTPIPFSYGVHLWTVCLVYILFLPFQLWKQLGYVTIPATGIVAFLFFGFLAAGEEIENPFGVVVAQNDLNMDHFCQNIIHAELLAITSAPVPNPSEWVFTKNNDSIFGDGGAICSPEDWVKKGEQAMRDELKRGLAL